MPVSGWILMPTICDLPAADMCTPKQNQFTLVKNPVVNGKNLDYYRYDGGDIKGTREELIAMMESVKVADVYAAITKLI